ncbi:hypothetical protein ASD78_13630 [Lysobacter sp. Root667]|uniref:hypothetical protein n=1 Tax=Lysobacter sp. Root667 TaxID=1736581 RepID=UPI0006FC3A11|nr:hypothetical protein [Lysobacter sp. Root667]KRA74499.1 hypothetical protein ASD78_13630 [Lysobacter sp. Root667]
MTELSDRMKADTREEWREFGFFYTSDDSAKEWLLSGDKAGLLGFADMLDAYAAEPRFATKSEHEHFGPHWYLKVVTWSEARIDGHAIWGSQADIARLAQLVRSAVKAAQAGDSINIREQYSGDSEYTLVLKVQVDGFDPASLDPQLAG